MAKKKKKKKKKKKINETKKITSKKDIEEQYDFDLISQSTKWLKINWNATMENVLDINFYVITPQNIIKKVISGAVDICYADHLIIIYRLFKYFLQLGQIKYENVTRYNMLDPNSFTRVKELLDPDDTDDFNDSMFAFANITQRYKRQKDEPQYVVINSSKDKLITSYLNNQLIFMLQAIKSEGYDTAIEWIGKDEESSYLKFIFKEIKRADITERLLKQREIKTKILEFKPKDSR